MNRDTLQIRNRLPTSSNGLPQKFSPHPASRLGSEHHRHVLAAAHLDEADERPMRFRYQHEVIGLLSRTKWIGSGIAEELLDTLVGVFRRDDVVEHPCGKARNGRFFAGPHRPIDDFTHRRGSIREALARGTEESMRS